MLFLLTLKGRSSNWVGLGGPRCLSEEAELHSEQRVAQAPCGKEKSYLILTQCVSWI